MKPSTVLLKRVKLSLFCDTEKCGAKAFETVGGVIDAHYASLTTLVITTARSLHARGPLTIDHWPEADIGNH